MAGAQIIKPRRLAAFAIIIGFYCLVAGGLIYLGLVNPGHAAEFFIAAGGTLVQSIYHSVQKWRLLRYGEEIQRRMQETVTPPTIDPR
jgi:hypothetical protein